MFAFIKLSIFFCSWRKNGKISIKECYRCFWIVFAFIFCLGKYLLMFRINIVFKTFSFLHYDKFWPWKNIYGKNEPIYRTKCTTHLWGVNGGLSSKLLELVQIFFIQIHTPGKLKEFSLCHKFKFSNPYIFAAWWCTPVIYQI